jgi:RHS repeat-associated protein
LGHLRHLWTGWTGREYDVELGMYYHRARYYSQSLRRFIQEDPVEGSTSPYAYVHGSPLEATDPSGMIKQWLQDDGLAYKLSITAQSDARLNGLLEWGNETWEKYGSAGGGGQLVAIVANGDGTTREVPCSEMQSECAGWLAPLGRPLSPGEVKQLGNFCDHVRCGDVRIYPVGRGLTLGHDIFLSEDRQVLPFLAHEMTHVAQYEDWGPLVYYARGTWEQFRKLLGIGKDPYEIPSPLPLDRPYRKYGMEQQAMITQECFSGSPNACIVSPFHPE